MLYFYSMSSGYCLLCKILLVMTYTYMYVCTCVVIALLENVLFRHPYDVVIRCLGFKVHMCCDVHATIASIE